MLETIMVVAALSCEPPRVPDVLQRCVCELPHQIWLETSSGGQCLSQAQANAYYSDAGGTTSGGTTSGGGSTTSGGGSTTSGGDGTTSKSKSSANNGKGNGSNDGVPGNSDKSDETF